jgi:hypothetical protein
MKNEETPHPVDVCHADLPEPSFLAGGGPHGGRDVEEQQAGATHLILNDIKEKRIIPACI